MFVVLIIEILLILGLIILTRSFLQTRRKAMLWTMVAVAGLIAIITIPCSWSSLISGRMVGDFTYG
ncbi:hypothetical protein [Lacticaseibacillus manihotivorans]|uniref:hypothetical protein n=1 Tax=Lacticaseibacillus manihotivorans TaxID=88233 RepID=UPI0006D1D1F7|nr:hypothetical protein [Lacticaseibacillus manihotivorans]